MSFFTNGGAEANENAIKLARWYTGRHKVIARYRSYHGLPARDRLPATRGAGRQPGIPGVVRMLDLHLPLPGRHPTPPGLLGGAASRRSSARAGERRRRDHGDDRRDNGIIVPPGGYLESIREVRDGGIVLILDEVMAGFGRSGNGSAARTGRRPGHPHLGKDQLRLRALGAMVINQGRRLGTGQVLRGRAHVLVRACVRGGDRLDRGFQEGIVENSCDGQGAAASCRGSRAHRPSAKGASSGNRARRDRDPQAAVLLTPPARRRPRSGRS
jgi:hypothetical protein